MTRRRPTGKQKRKPCHTPGCPLPAIWSERYCLNCKATVFQTMKDAKFVRDVKGPRSLRTCGARESVAETRSGIDE